MEYVLGESAVRVRVQLMNLRLINNFHAFVGFKYVGWNRWKDLIWIFMANSNR